MKTKLKKQKAWAVVNSSGEIRNTVSFKRRQPPMAIYSQLYKPDIKDYYAPDTQIVEVEIVPLPTKRRRQR